MLGFQLGQCPAQGGGLVGADPLDEMHQRRLPVAGVGGLVQGVDHEPGHQFVPAVDRRVLMCPVVADLRATKQNRNVFTTKDLAGAIAFASPLSYPVVADQLPALLSRALG